MKLCSGDCHWNTLEYNIGLGNGLMPSGNRKFHEKMLIQIFVATWRRMATMGINPEEYGLIDHMDQLECSHEHNT